MFCYVIQCHEVLDLDETIAYEEESVNNIDIPDAEVEEGQDQANASMSND